MTTPDHSRYAAALARTVDLLRRSKEAGEPQKAALRALVALAAERSATIRFYDSVVTIDGAPIGTADPRLNSLGERLAAHNLAEIVIARGAEANELLALTTGLAADAGQGRIKEKLRDASSTRVMVVVHQAIDPGHRPVSVTGAFAKVKLDEAVLSEWNKFLNHGAQDAETEVNLGFKAQATGEMQISMEPPGSAPRVPHVDPKIPAPPPAPALAPPAPSVAQTPTLQANSPLGIGLARVLGDPYGRDILTRLTQLSRNIEDYFSKGDGAAEAIDAVNTLVELEKNAPDAQVRGTYGVMLGRMLTRPALAKTAPFMLEPRRRQRAIIVLRRGGLVSSELLVTLIGQAQGLGERVLYADVLKDIPGGVDKLLSQLNPRSDWLVVRNLAELAGEARLDGAVPYLATLLDTNDDRVKRAVLVAMAKIGSTATVEPLRAVLKSGAPELKSLIAASVSGAHARPLTAPLAAAANEDDNTDVARACIKAIARIGTPEARQALERIAAQKSLFSFRGKAVREAADEALKTFAASTPA